MMKFSAIFKWRIIAVVVLNIACGTATSFAQDLWLMKGHDTRRTGQSKTNGLKAIDPSKSWVVEAPAAFVINIGATVTETGVYFASWGLLRKDALGRDERFWDKSDGKLYGHRLANGQPLWKGPLNLDLTARCYEYPDRPKTSQDNFWCGGANDYHVTFYNGTVEGQATVDTARNVLFPVYTTTMAVGSDGTIYVGGYYPFLLNSIPVIFAIEEVQTPQGIQPRFKWAKPYVELREGAQVGQSVGGIALREEGGQTKRLYVTTSIVRNPLTNHLEEGKLYAVDPATGQVLAEYDPSVDVLMAVGALNSPAVGADGIIYFGVRGKYELGNNPAVNGHVFAVEYDANTAQFHKVWHYQSMLFSTI